MGEFGELIASKLVRYQDWKYFYYKKYIEHLKRIKRFRNNKTHKYLYLE